ncbi:MAG TPA: ATP-binding protein [Thermoanaerobaculia bacterium]|jgi:PAS domain S-box-containing protein|nr:ATP-binding protein [Thermoanaerobaculia bacterium]
MRSLQPGLSSAQRRLERLQREAAASSQPQQFAAELRELQASLAELEVAYEELEQQNDELLTTREELEYQRHRYRDLFDQAPFGYFVTDLHGVVEEANRAAADLVGVPQVHLPGKPFTTFLNPGDRPAFRQLLPRLCAGESEGEQEMMLRRRQGDAFPALLNVVRDLDDQQRTARLRWAIRDVSQTKAAEEALRASEERLRHSQRMEAVGRLAGGIAHSFNNLLAAMAFQCELLTERLDDGDERRVHVEEIQKAGERAAALAHQLLAFGRRQVLQPRVLSLNEVLRDTEPMLRRLVGENIRLETRLDPEAGSIHADLGQFEQVVLNLVVNARDAMPTGGTLTLSTASVEIAGAAGIAGIAPGAPPTDFNLPPGSYVQLTVSDTGTGMSPEVLKQLFEPFFTTKERGKGTGLGLATVDGIVHQSGGHIEVASEPGKGTRFVVLLPRAGEAAAAEPRPARSVRQPKRRGSEVVLLVEDEDNIREPAVEILESRGYKVLAAPDASQALTLADSHRGPIHILVTDVVMPGRSGNWLAEQLSTRRPGIRILYMSGYPEDSIAHHGVLAPSEHFLQKPFPPGQFLEKVREVLGAEEPV